MKRTAIILGIGTAMAVVPSVAAAGNNTAHVRPLHKAQVVVHVSQPHPVTTARVTVSRVRAHRFTASGISLLVRVR